MSHLATADMPELDFAQKQIEIFEQTRKLLAENNFTFQYYHLANSSAILNYPISHYNLVRPGISLYGHMPTFEMAEKMQLKPALKWKSKVMLIKEVKKGGTVGYGMTYIAQKDTKVAVVPVGYADGLPRSLSNNFQCLINGKRYNNVGSVCMDEFMVDVGNDYSVNLCDEVVILGKQKNNEILPYELANKINSIPYELTSCISGRVKKIIINE
jgi:alanine racemase